MQVQPADRVKAVILIVLIVGVMGFVVKTAFMRPKPEGAPPPVATNTTPGSAVTPNATAPPPGLPPDVAVSEGTGISAQPKGVNPFRTTVGSAQPGGGRRPTGGGGAGGGGGGQSIEPMRLGTGVVEEAEFRLAGVLIDKPSVAIVSRGGSRTEFLRVGSRAAYGYKIAEIRPRGIRVAQKKSSKWILVGERLSPPAAAIPIVPPGGGPSELQWNPSLPPGAPMPTPEMINPPRRTASASSVSDGWVDDLGVAKALASRSKRKIFVDFMATWCGPCKLLEAEVLNTSKFKQYEKQLVFLRIDVDAQPNVAQAYQIKAMPTQMVLRADGSVIRSTVGYGGPDTFFSFLNSALGA